MSRTDSTRVLSRFQRGLDIAKKAAQVLQTKYCVDDVFLIGSLLHPEQFTSHSDIDLAVSGLDRDLYFRAWDEVQSLGDDFTIDIVSMETASDSLLELIHRDGVSAISLDCDHFVGQQQLVSFMTASGSLVLIGRIQQELKEIQKLVDANHRLLEKLRTSQDQDYIGSIALNLHGFYCGVERILKLISQTVDQSVLDGQNWHQQLLDLMTSTIPTIRPAILSTRTRQLLGEFCSFRHVVINIYSFDLESERVQKLSQRLRECHELFQTDMCSFIDFLYLSGNSDS